MGRVMDLCCGGRVVGSGKSEAVRGGGGKLRRFFS